MNGWSSRSGDDRWDDEPAWVYEITWEWEPLPGQRYPGDPGRRKAVHTPIYQASRGDGRPSTGSGPEDQPPVRYDDPRAPQSRENPRPAPPPRDEPAWNRPVPLPGRLAEDRRTADDRREPQVRPGGPGTPEQRRGPAPVYGRPQYPTPPNRPDGQPTAPETTQPRDGRRPYRDPQDAPNRDGRAAAGPVPPPYRPQTGSADAGYYGRRPAQDEVAGRDPRPATGGPRPTTPESPHVYGSARPAPPDTFPTVRPAPGRVPDAPFDLRPAPQSRGGGPEPARPASQPTRVTPVRPVTPPAPALPPAPGRQSAPGRAAAHAEVPTRPLFAPARPTSSPTQPVSSPAQPVSSPAQPVSSPIRPVSSPARPVSAPAQPVSSPARPVSARTYPVPGETRPLPPAGHPASGSARPVSAAANPVSGPAGPVRNPNPEPRPRSGSTGRVPAPATPARPVSGPATYPQLPAPAADPTAYPVRPASPGPTAYRVRPASPGPATYPVRPVSAGPAAYPVRPVSASPDSALYSSRPVSAPADPSMYASRPVSAPAPQNTTAGPTRPVSSPAPQNPTTGQPGPQTRPARPVSTPDGVVRAGAEVPGQRPGDQPARLSERADPRPMATGRVTPGDDRSPEYRPERFTPEHERVDEYRRERITPGQFPSEDGPAEPDDYAAEPDIEAVEPVTAPPFPVPAADPGDSECGSEVEPFEPAGRPVPAPPANGRYELPSGPFAGAPADGSGSPVAGLATRSATPAEATAGRSGADVPSDSGMSWADSVWARTATPETQTPEAETSEADTRGSDTRGADARGADTRGADARGADTRGADTRGADTRGADTRGAETTESEITRESAGPRPISGMPILPSADYRHPQAEPAAPQRAVDEPTVDDTHGLGWLLSMSGFGGSTPVIEPAPEKSVPERAVPESSNQDEAGPNYVIPNQADSDQADLDQPAPNHADSNQAVPNQALVDQAVPNQAVPEEAVLETALPEDEPAAATVPAPAESVVEPTEDVRPVSSAQPEPERFAPSNGQHVIAPAATAPAPTDELDVDVDVTEPPGSTTPPEPSPDEADQHEAGTREPLTIAEPEIAPTATDPADVEQAEAGQPEAELPEPEQAEPEQPKAELPEAQQAEPEQAEPEQAEPETTPEPVADSTPVNGPLADPDPTAVSRAEPEPVAEPETETEDVQPAADPTATDDKIGHVDEAPGDTPAEKTAETGQTTDSPAHAVPEKGETGSPGPDPVQTGTPRAPIRQRRDQSVQLEARRPDPERVIQAYTWFFDPVTLRERVEDTDRIAVVIDRLTDKLEYAERDTDRARLLSLRAVASRLAGDLDLALEDGRAALGHAEATGALRDLAVARARLAHVLQWLGEYAEADRLFTEAASPELPGRLLAEVHELAGRSAFEQGRYLEAVNHFELALDLRREEDPEMIERIERALDVVTERTTGGWGPYPRTREEILGLPEAPRPLRDERSGLWGYVGAVPPRYAQAQAFAEGLAWVRRPESPAWELIDQVGQLIVDASSGYRAAGRFAEGLAWVSRDEASGWYAVDRQNRVIVPGGFEDAKPFHHGLALVKRGGWGAVDRHGRVVVQPRYRGFATALSSGGRVDGFTDEGLAVIDAGDRFGVVDRTGQLVVAPVHAAVLIHPTAFLIADRYGLWGALDRAGEPLVGAKYRDRADVLDEIVKVRTDIRPLL